MAEGIAAPFDILVVGAGAAGLMAALAARGALDRSGARRAVPSGAPTVLVLDGSPKVGLKILVSGGGRCNVTNEQVTERDFETDAPHVVRGLLAAFPPASARAFFETRGCPLYAEPMGKLFPASDRAADVLGTLLRAVEAAGIRLASGAEAVEVKPRAAGWRVQTADGTLHDASRLCIATGGKSLPKTGSRGFGFACARALGQAVAPPLPALAPLHLAAGGPLDGLAGVTVPALLSLVERGTPPEQVYGARFRPRARAGSSFLCTHRGASGPAALDVSGACATALDRGDDVALLGDFWSLTRADSPYRPFRSLDKPPGASLPPGRGVRPVALADFLAEVRAALPGEVRAADDAEPDRTLAGELATRMPRALASALLARAGVDPRTRTARLSDGAWRRVHLAVTQTDLLLAGTGGFDKAEVTRGGVLLADLGRTTLESRIRPGLFFCGEVLHATGRLGGFNFQWAWSSGFAAGRGAARSLQADRS